jgi:predicted nucleotidyltransferase
MTITNDQKDQLKTQIKDRLANEREIQKIVIFGSFTKSNEPNDIDIAVFQNSDESYLSLALKYRKLVRDLSRLYPIDVIPLRTNANGSFLDEIENGETIYER